jgi:hypothetical protein
MTRAWSVRSLRRLAGAALLFAAGAAHAHSTSVGYVQVVPAPGDSRGIVVEIDLALRDLALTLPIDADRDEAITWAELSAARPDLETRVLGGLRVSRGGVACTLAPDDLATRRYDDGTYATLRLAGRCPADGDVAVASALFAGQDDRHRLFVTTGTGPDTVVSIATPVAGIPPAPPGAGGTFVVFLRDGVHHILAGYDHLAFLLSLVLPAMLVRRDGRWHGATDVRARLRDVFWLVTAFTAAHSLTLSLAALGWIAPSSRIVEATIAASVVLAALNNVRPVVSGRVWPIGLAFGLVHGFGFAGALAEVGLPDAARWRALLGFNLGVELGQLAVLAVVLPPLVAVRHRAGYARVVLPAASLLIAAVAAGWLVQRLA